MAIEWDIYLGTTGPTGKLSPFGRSVTIAVKEATREQRAADGTLKSDCLYVKREFTLSYAYITEAALDTLDFWYAYYKANPAPLSLYMYTGPVSYDEYKVVPRPVDRTRVVKATDNLFSGVKFVMVEV
jgi:hypothetical protein